MHMDVRQHERLGVRQWLTAALAGIIAAAVILFGAPLPASAAETSTGGVTLTVEYGGKTYNGSIVVTPGTSYTARVQYSVPELTPGGSATIAVPDGVTVPASALVVPAGNTVVESLALNADGDVVMTFKNPLDKSINQGVISFDFVFDKPETGTGYRDVTWSVDGQDTSVRVIVQKPGDELQPPISAGQNKTVGGVDLNRYVSLKDGRIGIDPAVATVAIPYTVSIDSGDERALTLTDTLGDYLAYDQGSFSAMLTTWDEDGFNKTTAPFALPAPSFAGSSFTVAGIDLPERSKLAIAYKAHIDPAKLDALREALQAEADKVAAGGSYSVALRNSADIDGVVRTTTVTIGGRINAAPSPNLGSAFAKQSSLAGQTQITLDADGRLAAPIDVTYTLKANLTEFAKFAGTQHELARNVVITDTLPAQISWHGGDFLTTTAGELALREAPSDVTAEDFASDAYVGFYQLGEDGKTLRINVGADTGKSYAFQAKAQVTSIEGLTAEKPGNQPQVEALYKIKNTATFQYKDATGARNASVENTLFVPKTPGSVIDDPSEFKKTTGGQITVRPGQSAAVTFTFELAAGAVPDLRTSRIIDEINHSVFDVSDLEKIRSSISGTYAGGRTSRAPISISR
jgi:serine-aspartate repeat-containing protein C/D/E